MELSTWLRWRQMEEVRNIPRIKLGRNMELDIVMLNAAGVPSFLVRLPLKIGEVMEPAALSSISGKPTNRQAFILATPAKFLAIIDAKEISVAPVTKDTKEFAIKMGVV
jgi:hypothetical protein